MTYNYDVVIRGIDAVPFRTTAQGAKLLMQSFHEEPGMEKLILEAVDSGTPFKNKLISIKAVFPEEPKKKTVEPSPKKKRKKKTNG